MNINTEKSVTKSKHKNNKKPLYICKTRRAAKCISRDQHGRFYFQDQSK